MTPQSRKIGDRIKILCPDCDGSGVKEPTITTDTEHSISDIPQPCDTCKGEKEVEGIVSRQ